MMRLEGNAEPVDIVELSAALPHEVEYVDVILSLALTQTTSELLQEDGETLSWTQERVAKIISCKTDLLKFPTCK